MRTMQVPSLKSSIEYYLSPTYEKGTYTNRYMLAVIFVGGRTRRVVVLLFYEQYGKSLSLSFDCYP